MFHYVYITTNQINGKEYVGVHSTKNLDDRYLGSGKLIQQAISKHGPENFRRDILFMFDRRASALNCEAMLVNQDYIAREDTYNIKVGGEGGGVGGEYSAWASDRRDELRQKFSEIFTGRVVTEIHRERISATLKQWFQDNGSHRRGAKWSDGSKQRMSNTVTGRKHTPETVEKIRQGNLGKVRTPEMRERYSQAKKGKKLSEEHVRKIAESKRGKKPTYTEEGLARKREQAKGNNNPAASQVRYVFTHSTHGEFIGTRCDLCTTYALSPAGLTKLFLTGANHRQQYKGWCVTGSVGSDVD